MARLRKVVGGRDLHVARLTLDETYRVARRLGQLRLVGAVTSGASERDSIPQHAVSEGLRRLRQKDRVPLQRFPDARAPVRTLHGVAGGEGRNGGAFLERGIDGSGNQVGCREGPRRIVNHHDIGVGADPIERIGHRILRRSPPGAKTTGVFPALM